MSVEKGETDVLPDGLNRTQGEALRLPLGFVIPAAPSRNACCPGAGGGLTCLSG